MRARPASALGSLTVALLGATVFSFGLPAPAAFGQTLARPASDATATDRRPNVVFILSDDHRWDALGAAGNARIHTPHLDRLAREGTYFRQATVFVSQCTPSRAVLMTGLPPHTSGLYSIRSQRRDLWWRDSLALPVVPGLLREAGYRTVLVGKWHLQSDPWKTGFSDVRSWLNEGVAAYRDPMLSRGDDRRVEQRTGFTNELFADDAVAFLRSAEARAGPFLLWLALTAPHTPAQPNPAHVAHLYDGRATADLLPPAFPDGATPGDFLHYAEAVSLVDDITGRVVAALAERGLAGNTVVVFMGDNGHMMGSRGLSGKIVPYDESVRIPLIVAAPGRAMARGPSEAAVSSLDLPPTLLRLAGVAVPPSWPGRDLSGLLRGRGAAGFGEAFGEWADEESGFGRDAYRLVRTARHKLIRWRRADRPNSTTSPTTRTNARTATATRPSAPRASGSRARSTAGSPGRTTRRARGRPAARRRRTCRRPSPTAPRCARAASWWRRPCSTPTRAATNSRTAPSSRSTTRTAAST